MPALVSLVPGWLQLCADWHAGVLMTHASPMKAQDQLKQQAHQQATVLLLL